VADYDGVVYDLIDWIPQVDPTSPPAPGDETDPVVTVISTPTVAADPYVVHVSDETALGPVVLWASFGASRPWHMIYDGAAFGPRYSTSTLTGAGTTGDPLVFTLRVSGGWPVGIPITVYVRAVDSSGNQELD
jgi:hypothetical protein